MEPNQNTAASGWWAYIARASKEIPRTAWLTISALTLTYALTAFALIRTMDHSTWLIVLSGVSFIVIQWTLWFEFRPKHPAPIQHKNLISDSRIIGAFGGVFNFILIALACWFFKGSLPFIGEFTLLGIVFFLMSMALIPISAWASCIFFPRKY